MEQKKSMMDFLNTMTPVFIVWNDKLPDNPLVTKLVDSDGNARVDILGNEIGSIRLEQHSSALNGSYLNSRKRVAFISGTYEDLMSRVKNFGLQNGTEVPGKIIVLESLEPMWKGHNPKINPNSPEQPIGVRNGDELIPVYMQMKYTTDMNAKDYLIRTIEDVSAWLAQRQVVADRTKIVQKAETAGIPQAAAALPA